MPRTYPTPDPIYMDKRATALRARMTSRLCDDPTCTLCDGLPEQAPARAEPKPVQIQPAAPDADQPFRDAYARIQPASSVVDFKRALQKALGTPTKDCTATLERLGLPAKLLPEDQRIQRVNAKGGQGGTGAKVRKQDGICGKCRLHKSLSMTPGAAGFGLCKGCERATTMARLRKAAREQETVHV